MPRRLSGKRVQESKEALGEKKEYEYGPGRMPTKPTLFEPTSLHKGMERPVLQAQTILEIREALSRGITVDEIVKQVKGKKGSSSVKLIAQLVPGLEEEGLFEPLRVRDKEKWLRAIKREGGIAGTKRRVVMETFLKMIGLREEGERHIASIRGIPLFSLLQEAVKEMKESPEMVLELVHTLDASGDLRLFSMRGKYTKIAYIEELFVMVPTLEQHKAAIAIRRKRRYLMRGDRIAEDNFREVGKQPLKDKMIVKMFLEEQEVVGVVERRGGKFVLHINLVRTHETDKKRIEDKEVPISNKSNYETLEPYENAFDEV